MNDFYKLNKKLYYNYILQTKSISSILKKGRIHRKRIILVIGNFKNKFAIGISKNSNANIAMKKARFIAQKNIIQVPITTTYSIPHSILSSFGAATILLQPANLGIGITGTPHLQVLLNISGIKNLVSKQFESSSILNNNFAVFKGIKILNRLIWLAKTRSTSMYQFYIDIIKKY